MEGVRGSEHLPAPAPQEHMRQASDGDPDHTNGRVTTRRPNPQHNMVYVTCENLKLCPFYDHKKSANRCKKCQTCPSQLDTGV
jgi:hypothetical protein